MVRLALEELGVAYEDVLVDRAAGEQRSAAFRELNPQGLLPVLEDGELVLFETAAILLHLGDREGALVPELGTAGRSECYKWLAFIANTLHADLRVRFYTSRYTDDPDSVPAMRRALAGRISGHFDLLDREIAGHDGPWLLDSGLSVCDLYLGLCARWSQLFPMDARPVDPPPAARPHLRCLLEALEARPAVARACHREGVPAPFFSAPLPAQPTEGSVV
ncbi:MAG: glutathione S-transferase N-terminal domain-containing protein [Arhodomonas sp.]|nr:glutathione S-transferase N-terminal domain-containing protein [Arhodomonas sp.]